ncbi:MAG: hypothetical protein ACRDGM_20785, partial [bacterium]
LEQPMLNCAFSSAILEHALNGNWWYQKYAPGNTTLERLETEAREAQRGLWADPHQLPPWETQGMCEARRGVP